MINEMLGIKYPIFQGAMANISTAEFAADVSNSGALGIIGTGAMDAKMVRDSIRKCKELTDKPFGVNIMLMNPYCDDIIEVILEEKVAVVTTGAGNPGAYVERLKAKGIKIIPVVPSVALARRMESIGVDAVIVDDFGFAKYIIDNFPGMEVHGSTQMTIHNLDGAIALKNLGYSRVVLARESTLSDIDYICRNANIDIEAFVHGALCISYSGQCLFSSAIGGRSGNRGRCAQPCRMYYNMLETSDNVSYKNCLLYTSDAADE